MVMMIKVEAVATIKPSSPTPGHLRHHNLSFLDQIAPPIFMPLTLFFPNDSNSLISNAEKCEVIKHSLSLALAQYYPLAGRVKDNLYVDCSDEGAHYVEVRVDCQLSDILDNPTPQAMKKLLPFALHEPSELVTAVQVSFFECGGLAVGLCISHKVADGLSYFAFLNSWAALARGDESKVIVPSFDTASLFPPMDISGYQPNTGIVTDAVTRRFVFDAEALAALRARYTDTTNAEQNQVRHPTRVEALSAFLWSRYVASTIGAEESLEDNGVTTGGKVYTVLHAVNLRTRMDPPLTERQFGNMSRIAVSMPSLASIKDGRGHEIVCQFREAIKRVDAEYVRKIQQGEEHLSYMKERGSKIMKGEVVPFSFTSLCKFPMHEADFGWGKAVWVGSAGLPFRNVAVLLDTKSGDGIEAWCNLREEDLAKLEKDEELLSYASARSSVI